MTKREFRKKLIADGVSPKIARCIADASAEMYRLYDKAYALTAKGKTEKAAPVEAEILSSVRALTSVSMKIAEVLTGSQEE